MPAPTTWGDAYQRVGITLPPAAATRPWAPTDADKAVAWDLYTEIRSRISAEALHYRAGDEETALESVYKLFGFTREIVKKQGLASRLAAGLTIGVLNTHVRPFTARWHKAKVEKTLAIEDERHRFRSQLKDVQAYLIRLMNVLGEMAEAADHLAIAEPPLPVVAAAPPKPAGSALLFEADVRLHRQGIAPTPIITPMFAEEEAEIRRRRTTHAAGQLPSGRVGLALSGGGIRSSTFSLGVIQALARHGLIQHVDYLSTVSGGGYVGSFLSAYFNSGDAREPSWSELAGDSKPIRYLRDNVGYLATESPIEKLGTACFLIYGMVINALPLIAMLAVLVALTFYAPVQGVAFRMLHGTGWAISPAVWLGLGAAAALMLLSYPVLQRLMMVAEARGLEVMAAIALGLIGVGLAVELAALIARPLANGAGVGRIWSSIAVGVPLAGTAGAIVARAVASAGGARVLALLASHRAIGLRVLWVLVGLVGIGLPAGLYLFLAQRFVFTTVHLWSVAVDSRVVGGVAAFLGMYVLVFLNVNRTSPHVLYRSRLCRTFLLRPDTSPKAVSRRKRLNLTELTRGPEPVAAGQAIAPYHLVCAASNVPRSQTKSLQGRGADFFLFSKHFCGSPSTGYCKTAALEEADGHLDLGTAMAISGAAASSLMGGISPKQALWALTLLNVRLGYWVPNPSRLTSLSGMGAGAGPRYLLKEHTGRADETARYVNVSDGGHIENLGVYELLRRRCKIIIAVDGEADPAVRCGSMMKLMRYAEVDLDVRIDLDLGDIHIDADGLSRAHFNIGTIHYPSTGGSNTDGTGVLVYVKASRTGDEPPPVADYHLSNPVFPHQTTADQFFDEAQFESYRLLGNHVGEQMFRRDLLDGPYTTVAAWRDSLTSNLLE